MTNNFPQRFKDVKVLFKDLTGKDADQHLELYLPFFNAFYAAQADQNTGLLLKEIEALKKEITTLKTELNKEQVFQHNPLL